MTFNAQKSWVNGQECDSISTLDRGLLYGHSVFTTLRINQGRACLLDLHLQRLQSACDTLFIPLQASLESEIKQFCMEVDDGVLRVTLSIGSGGRGYASPLDPNPERILTLHALPDYEANAIHREGVLIGISDIRLAAQPLLAGLKHGNRLEQILIRRSWQKDWREALVFDQEDLLVEATQSNVFARHGQTVITPRLDKAGVAGVMRRFILESKAGLDFDIQEGSLRAKDLSNADELVLTNCVIGAWPVAQIKGNSLLADKTFKANEFKLTHSLTKLFDEHGVF